MRTYVQKYCPIVIGGLTFALVSFYVENQMANYRWPTDIAVVRRGFFEFDRVGPFVLVPVAIIVWQVLSTLFAYRYRAASRLGATLLFLYILMGIIFFRPSFSSFLFRDRLAVESLGNIALIQAITPTMYIFLVPVAVLLIKQLKKNKGNYVIGSMSTGKHVLAVLCNISFFATSVILITFFGILQHWMSGEPLLQLDWNIRMNVTLDQFPINMFITMLVIFIVLTIFTYAITVNPRNSLYAFAALLIAYSLILIGFLTGVIVVSHFPRSWGGWPEFARYVVLTGYAPLVLACMASGLLIGHMDRRSRHRKREGAPASIKQQET